MSEAAMSDASRCQCSSDRQSLAASRTAPRAAAETINFSRGPRHWSSVTFVAKTFATFANLLLLASVVSSLQTSGPRLRPPPPSLSAFSGSARARTRMAAAVDATTPAYSPDTFLVKYLDRLGEVVDNLPGPDDLKPTLEVLTMIMYVCARVRARWRVGVSVGGLCVSVGARGHERTPLCVCPTHTRHSLPDTLHPMCPGTRRPGRCRSRTSTSRSERRSQWSRRTSRARCSIKSAEVWRSFATHHHHHHHRRRATTTRAPTTTTTTTTYFLQAIALSKTPCSSWLSRPLASRSTLFSAASGGARGQTSRPRLLTCV